MKEVTRVISENRSKGTQMVVVQVTIPGRTNRLGQPYKTSVTKHRRMSRKSKVNSDQ